MFWVFSIRNHDIGKFEDQHVYKISIFLVYSYNLKILELSRFLFLIIVFSQLKVSALNYFLHYLLHLLLPHRSAVNT